MPIEPVTITYDDFSSIMEEVGKAAGNNDLTAGAQILIKLALVLNHERKKQPCFAEGQYHALGKIEDRMTDFSDAVLKRDFTQKVKAYALIAALVRFLNEEHLPEVTLE